MGEDIRYGPEQLPWEETLSSLAKNKDGTYMVSAPSQPLGNVYDYKDQDKGITPRYYQVTSKGFTADEARRAQDETFRVTTKQSQNFLGYQCNLHNDYSIASKYLTTMLNNIGDPFTPGSFTLNSKWMERNVLDYYASLWNAKWPHDSTDADSYWGYLLTMGSSEANLYGMWNARDYLQGKFMMTDKTGKRPRTYYVQAKLAASDNTNAFTPVAFYSSEAHYSIVKAMAVMEIKTFYQLGKELYPGQCPIPGEDWPEEVPAQESGKWGGSVDVDKLVALVNFFASKGYPILCIFNYGTTFKGAYDDVETATSRLITECLEPNDLNERTILVRNPDHPAIIKRVKRKGYWFHVDGALGASYVPFIKMAFKAGRTSIEPPPNFDFSIPYVCSINTSGHKWPGAPWPCGIYMTKTGLQLLPPSDPDYIGSPDTTFAGSRNGLSAVNWWTYISTNSYEAQVEKVVHCLALTEYTFNQLKKMNKEIWLQYTPLTLSIQFKKPNDEITYKYSLAVETMPYGDGQRTYIHLYIMSNVTKEMINNLLYDLNQPNAFDSTPSPVPNKARAAKGDDDDDDDGKGRFRHGIVLRKKNAALRGATKVIMEWPRGGRGFM